MLFKSGSISKKHTVDIGIVYLRAFFSFKIISVYLKAFRFIYVGAHALRAGVGREKHTEDIVIVYLKAFMSL